MEQYQRIFGSCRYDSAFMPFYPLLPPSPPNTLCTYQLFIVERQFTNDDGLDLFPRIRQYFKLLSHHPAGLSEYAGHSPRPGRSDKVCQCACQNWYSLPYHKLCKRQKHCCHVRITYGWTIQYPSTYWQLNGYLSQLWDVANDGGQAVWKIQSPKDYTCGLNGFVFHPENGQPVHSKMKQSLVVNR